MGIFIEVVKQGLKKYFMKIIDQWLKISNKLQYSIN